MSNDANEDSPAAAAVLDAEPNERPWLSVEVVEPKAGVVESILTGFLTTRFYKI